MQPALVSGIALTRGFAKRAPPEPGLIVDQVALGNVGQAGRAIERCAMFGLGNRKDGIRQKRLEPKTAPITAPDQLRLHDDADFVGRGGFHFQ
jgi:hypothetical protein